MKTSPVPQIENEFLNRLMKTLEAALLESQRLDEDFRLRLQESIQQTETRLQLQFAETGAQEIKRAEEEARKGVTRELLVRFEIEFQKLSNEFEDTRRRAIAATEAAAQLRLKEALDEAERAKELLRREFESAAKQWERDRQEYDPRREKNRLEEQLREAESRWNIERNNLKSEMEQSRQELLARFDARIEQLKAEFEERRVQEIAATQTAAEIRFGQILAQAKQESDRRENEVQAAANQQLQNANQQFDAEKKLFGKRITELEEELKGRLEQVTQEKTGIETEFREAKSRWDAERERLQAVAPGPADKPDVSEAARAEISRVEGLIREIVRKMELSSTDLGSEIRMSRERAELESYLNGLRFSALRK